MPGTDKSRGYYLEVICAGRGQSGTASAGDFSMGSLMNLNIATLRQCSRLINYRRLARGF
jgi:hypothetical protein